MTLTSQSVPARLFIRDLRLHKVSIYLEDLVFITLVALEHRSSALLVDARPLDR